MNEQPPINILLVDDLPQNIVALKAILKNPEYRLISTNSGNDALRIALREQLAVILLDVVMPDMDGFEVARHLKELERTRDIPILFLTGVANEIEQIYRAYAVGAVDYLVKPLDPEIVRKKVAVLVDLVQKREQIERQAERLREAERREFELSLAELRMASDRRYRKVIEGIDCAIGWSADGATLRLTFVNRRAERILGYRNEEWLEPDFWQQHLHPQDRETVLDLFHRAVAEEADFALEHRMIAADGRVVWLHTSVGGERLSGEPLALDGVSIDITRLKSAEQTQALLADVGSILSASLDYRETLPRLAARLVPQLADGCVIDGVKRPGVVERIAEAHAEPIHPAWERILAGKKRTLDSKAPAGIANVLRTGRAELHREVTDPDWLADAVGAQRGDSIRMLGRVSCMFVPISARGRVLAVMTLVSSQSQRKLGPAELALAEELGRKAAAVMDNSRLYEEAQRATRAREALLAVVSHDLRNLLSVILLGAKTISSVRPGREQAERVRRAARTVSQSAERMQRLIGDLLDFARIQAGQLEIQRQSFDSAALVRESVELLEPLASEKGIRLEGRTSPEAFSLCDHGRAIQILSNLVGNAIKFTDEGGRVTVTAEKVGDQVRFAISDSGPGISEEQLPHIWERFWQADKKTDVGFGLGLSIAKVLVEAQGGHIWVDSKLGSGTTFYFTLPLVRAQSHHNEIRP